MKIKSLLLFFCLFSHLVFADFVGLDLLKEHKNRRYTTFSHLFALLAQTRPQVIVETGTSRQGKAGYSMDGASTLLFSEFAKKNNCTFYSVDISEENIHASKSASLDMFGEVKQVHFVVGDSIAFLQNFDQKIDCLYLDSFDFEYDNPRPSQMHHLKEIIAAYPHLSEQCLIMIDDCDLPHGGKGALVIPWLERRGWSVIHKDYQVILVRNNK